MMMDFNILFVFIFLYMRIFGEDLKETNNAGRPQKMQYCKVNVILFMATTILEKKDNTLANGNCLERCGFILAAKVREMKQENGRAACHSKIQCSKNSLLEWAKTFKNMTTVTLSLIKEEENISCSPGKHENRKLYEYQVDFQNKKNLVVSPLVRGKIFVGSSITQNDKSFGENHLDQSRTIKNLPFGFPKKIQKTPKVLEESKNATQLEKSLHPKSNAENLDKEPPVLREYYHKDQHGQILPIRPINEVNQNTYNYFAHNKEQDLPHLLLKPLYIQMNPPHLGKYNFHQLELRPINNNKELFQLIQKQEMIHPYMGSYSEKNFNDINHNHFTKSTDDNNNPGETYSDVKPKTDSVNFQKSIGITKIGGKPKQNTVNSVHHNSQFGDHHDLNGVNALKSTNLPINGDDALYNQNKNHPRFDKSQKSEQINIDSTKSPMVRPFHFDNVFNVHTTEKQDLKMDYPQLSTSEQIITTPKTSENDLPSDDSIGEIISDSERFNQYFPFLGIENVHRTKRGISIDEESEESFANPASKSDERRLAKESYRSVIDSSKDNAWNLLGMMSAFKNSFFSDIYKTMYGRTRSAEEDDLYTRDIGKVIEEPSLAALLLQVIQDAELQSGYLIFVEGFNINDLRDCKSDLSKGIIAARKATKISQTLVVVMGSCPTSTTRNQIQNLQNNNRRSKDLHVREDTQQNDLLDRLINSDDALNSKIKDSRHDLVNAQTYHNYMIYQKGKEEKKFPATNSKKSNHDSENQKKNLDDQVKKTFSGSLHNTGNSGKNSDETQKHSTEIRDDQCTTHHFIPVYASGPGQRHLVKAKSLENIPFLIRDVIMANGRTSRDLRRIRSFNVENPVCKNEAKLKPTRSFLNCATSVYLHSVFIIISAFILVI